MTLINRFVRTADRTTRPAADAPCLLHGAASGSPSKPRHGEWRFDLARPVAGAPQQGCGESNTYSMPNAESLRRCWEWQRLPQTSDVNRIAHHEAGHVVIGEWLHLPGIKATVEPCRGLMTHGLDFGALSEPGPDEDGRCAATAASLFLAGFAAEMLWLKCPWAGPAYHPEQTDFQHTEDMLAQRFGRLSSAGHGYATRVALAVLASRWGRVQEIAGHLARHGEWRA